MSCETMTIEQAYAQLAGAICEQAVKDYHVALALAKEGGKRFIGECASLERFFRSDWFATLTRENVDGEWVIEKVREKCKTSKNISGLISQH